MCLQLASLAHLGSLSMLRCSEVTRTSRTGSRRKAGMIFATRAAHQLQVYIVLMPWLLRMDLCALFYARLRIYTHTYKRMCAGVFGAGNYLQVGGWVYTPCTCNLIGSVLPTRRWFHILTAAAMLDRFGLGFATSRSWFKECSALWRLAACMPDSVPLNLWCFWMLVVGSQAAQRFGDLAVLLSVASVLCLPWSSSKNADRFRGIHCIQSEKNDKTLDCLCHFHKHRITWAFVDSAKVLKLLRYWLQRVLCSRTSWLVLLVDWLSEICCRIQSISGRE